MQGSGPEIAAERWQGASVTELAAEWGAPEVHLFQEAGSTNDIARRLAAAGAPSGTVVLAEHQTAGRGRVGRRWDSPRGLGIALSIVVRPAPGTEVGALPLLIGVVVGAALEPFLSPATATIKWPNDVLVDGRKLGGILCEATWEGRHATAVVAGLGLNLRHSPDDLPATIRDTATSLRIASGRDPDVRDVAGAVVRGIVTRILEPLEITPAEHAELASRDSLRGRGVDVLEPESGTVRMTGTALEITRDGALLLRDRQGVLRTVRTGTVRPASSTPASG